MKRLAAILLGIAAPLLAADEMTRRVVELKYASANQLSSLLVNFGVNSRSDDRLKAIVLTGSTEAVSQAEAAIRKLDVPPPPEKNIELLAYLVLASNEAPTGPEPADLAPAIKQMRTLFPYKSYRMLDTIWVRTRENERLESSGLAPSALKSDPNFDPVYRLTANRATLVSPDPKTVRFENLSLALTLREKMAVTIGSSFDVREGQKVVIGKTNPTGADTAVILVVTAKIVE